MSQEVLIDVQVIPDVDCWKIVLVTNKRRFAKILNKQDRLFDVWCKLLELANKFGKVLPTRAAEQRDEADGELAGKAPKELRTKDSVRGEICPSCGEREVFASGMPRNVRCFACEWTGQI